MWDPFRDVDRFLNGLNRTIGNAGGSYSLLGRGRWIVSADVVEDDSHYTVEVDVPGLKKEDVNVRVEDNDNRVCISGQRARPAYHKWIQGDTFGGGSNFSMYESTVTTIDEKGNVTSTTTTNKDDNDQSKNNNSKNNKIAVTQYDKSKDTTPRPLLLEKDFGEFERCFSFPRRIIRDSTTAELDNGVLKLTVEKAKGSDNHSVAVRGK